MAWGVSRDPLRWRTQHPLGSGPMLTTLPVVSGYPVPRLYWFKDGQPLTASAHIRMVNKKALHSLEILSVTSEDAGQYSAYISNTVGAAYSSAQLLVQGGSWGPTSASRTPMAGLGLGPRSSPPGAEVWWRADACLPAFPKVLGVGVGGCPQDPHPWSRPLGPRRTHCPTSGLTSLPLSGPNDPEKKPAAGEPSPDGGRAGGSVRVVGGMPIGWKEGGTLGTGSRDNHSGGWGPGPGRRAEAPITGLWLCTCHQQPPVSPQRCSNSWCHPASWRSSPLRR